MFSFVICANYFSNYSKIELENPNLIPIYIIYIYWN